MIDPNPTNEKPAAAHVATDHQGLEPLRDFTFVLGEQQDFRTAVRQAESFGDSEVSMVTDKPARRTPVAE